MSPHQQPDDPTLSPWRAAFGIALTLVLFGVAGAGLWIYSGRDIADFVRINVSGVLHGLLLAGVLIGIAAAAWRLFPRAGDRLTRLQAETFGMLGNQPPLLLIIAISIAAGVGEEAAMRGGLQTFLTDHLGPVAAIILAALTFALIHMSHWIVMALIFLIGLLFGTVYHLTGSLLTVMIGHAVYDVWAMRYLFSEIRRLSAQPAGES